MDFKLKLSFFLFRLYHSKLIWGIRRIFRKEASSSEVTAFRLNETFKILPSSKNGELSLGPTILIPSYRMDGIGIQVIIRLAVKYLARESGATYLHYPFIEIEHQQIDPLGSQMTSIEWCQEWESFFNLGSGEDHIRDWAKKIGPFELSRQLSNKTTVYLDPRDDRRQLLKDHIEAVRSKQAGMYIFSLGLIRQAEKCDFFFDKEFIQEMQELFKRSSYNPKNNLYEEDGIHIAIHIRRGDVWNNIKAGNSAKRFLDRLLDESFYVELLNTINRQVQHSMAPIHYHIFSDGLIEDFESFTIEEGRTILKSNPEISNIHLHLRTNAMDTLYHLIHAPILFPAKSTFSLLGIIFGEGKVILDDLVLEYSHYSILSKYIAQSDRFIKLDKLNLSMLQS